MSPAAALDAAGLGELLREIGDLFIGLELREVQGLPPRDLLLVFDVDDHVRRLRVSAAPDGPRLHLQHGRVQRYGGPNGPFFERAHALLAGARLARVEQPRGDRMALLGFDGAHASAGPSGRCSLLAELTGRRANLVLLDGSERVLDVLAPPPPPKQKGNAPARPPRLVTGEPWVPPPGAPPALEGEAPRLLDSLTLQPGQLEVEGGPRDVDAPLSRRVESVLGAQVERVHAEREARRVRERLERRLQRARSTVHGLGARREAAAGAERVRQDGELLKAALGQLQRGMTEIELDDWFCPDGGKRRIALDPKRRPQDNVERLFKRYQKLERAASEVERELERATEQVGLLEALLAESIEDDPLAVEARAVEAGLLEALVAQRATRRQEKKERLPYRLFTSGRGAEILVGRSSRDNDQLTFRIARGNDLWLHTSDSPGSHVVLRCRKGVDPHPEDVLDAALLAIHFSPQKEARRAGVHVVPIKQVRKPKGAPAGLVTLAGGKRRDVRMEPQRLQGLLDPGR